MYGAIIYAMALIVLAALFPEHVTVTAFGLAIAILTILLTRFLISFVWLCISAMLALINTRLFLVLFGVVPIKFLVHLWLIELLNQRLDGFLVGNFFLKLLLSFIFAITVVNLNAHADIRKG